jgi:hypothetical protein
MIPDNNLIPDNNQILPYNNLLETQHFYSLINKSNVFNTHFLSLTYLSLPRPYLMIHLTLLTGIQYIKFTAVGERAVHITITMS